jgi:flagellar motility protein MotE (MotC chaperone)
MRLRRNWALPFFVLILFVSAMGSVFAGGDDAEKKADIPSKDGFIEVHPTGTTPEAQPAPGVPTGRGGITSSACLVDPIAADDMNRRRNELDAREKELKSRDAELKARERALEEELQKIAAVREDIEKIEGARKKEGSDKVAKLVETFETMSPKTASALMSTLDESLAVATMSRIATPKLAKILNSMEPRKSARLSELLAGVVRARSAIPASNGAAVATQSAKGGERKNDGQIEQHDTIGERSKPEAQREPAKRQ